MHLGGCPLTSGNHFHTKWWEDNPHLHHWIPPHCWILHICIRAPRSLPDPGQPVPLHSIFCLGQLSPGAGSPRKRIQLPWLSASWVLQENALFYSPPCSPWVGRSFRRICHCWCPIASFSLPPTPVHHTYLCEATRKSWCFGWVKIQALCHKITMCCKTGGSDRKEKERAFPQ